MNIYNYKISNILLTIIIILIILSSYNIFRLVNFLLFPNNNIDATSNQMLKYINYEIAIQFISWFSYLLLVIIIFYINILQTNQLLYKSIISILLIIIIYIPIFPIINVINIILMIYCNNPPFIKNMESAFPSYKSIEKKYLIIKSEFDKYNNNNNIDCFRTNNPLLSNIDTIDIKNGNCWRTLYLKKSGEKIKNMEIYFPETMALLNDSQIQNAFFSILDPKVEIKPHIGYYKGYLRYHLGLEIPNESGKNAYLICGGEKYEWKNGESVIFDDMYLHYVNNPTSKKRVILYLDIKRNNLNPILTLIADFGNYLIENSYLLKIFIKNQHVQTKS